ncbi:diacylglycerol kinase (ATP) [Aliiroseovarius halocynthiae]|uniref:Diacylglycerol kinase n=1 Tax=Aliiroseovarius halocynthiae TaxID=985055 RepID=A0A545SY01_9RHOB|nr:diacylglycerol kinase [Aliiroseovarius halocynthiae]TQV69809.1 diacylglycerol kinase [Aliiroseovarius halocynthiae]SMR81716.1 diacylglycerol kinase (ATP) [Aliiroseovarius halocynthiae]
MLKALWQRFWLRCIWSWAGWRAAWRTEPSLWQWTIVCVISCSAALWMDLTRGETALLLALSLLVVASELINTAIERTVDLVTREQHDLAREAKDTASAFVALTALAGGVAWAAVLFG